MSLKTRACMKSSATAQQNPSPHLSSHYSINDQINTARVRERAKKVLEAGFDADAHTLIDSRLHT